MLTGYRRGWVGREGPWVVPGLLLLLSGTVFVFILWPSHVDYGEALKVKVNEGLIFIMLLFCVSKGVGPWFLTSLGP